MGCDAGVVVATHALKCLCNYARAATREALTCTSTENEHREESNLPLRCLTTVV